MLLANYGIFLVQFSAEEEEEAETGPRARPIFRTATFPAQHPY